MNIVTRSYESLLPFLVVEAISSQNIPYHQMSVKMMEKGWAWLVCGRKLLIWKFKDKDAVVPNLPKSRRILSPCFELQLPQSGLIHRAELVDVFFLPQNPNASIRALTVPAALVISPEGLIRFWSSVANERCTESTVGEFQGQEFCSLIPLSQLEYLLGTTTGLVFLLTVDIAAHDPKNILLCTPLATSPGLLHGIGRRVTNLFFGPMTTESGAETKRPLIAVPKYSQSTIDSGLTERPFFVMSSTFKLRHWSRANDGPNSINNLIREWDLQGVVYSRLSDILGQRINFWPIDMVTTQSNELLILIVTHDSAPESRIRYATCVFNPHQSSDAITSLVFLKSHSWRYTNESEEQLLSLRFLERQATSPLCFIYDRKFLFLVNTTEDVLDAIDYGNQSDGILGVGITDGHPILFTQRDGLIYVARSLTTPPDAHMVSTRDDRVGTSLTGQDARVQEENDALRNDLVVASSENGLTGTDQSMPLHDSTNLEGSVIGGRNLVVPSEDGHSVLADTRSNNHNHISYPPWIRLIDEKEYAKASESLARTAQESELPEDRRETLLALSKIAELAA